MKFSLWRRLTSWWEARTVAFRKVVRTSVFLLASMLVSLAMGVATASASSPLGPHEAQWSTTLDSRITLNLGPLGQASLQSPAGLLGVEIVVGEIPASARSAGQATLVTTKDLSQWLSSDGSAYMALVSHPQVTIEAGLRALAGDALRRAGLVEAVLLCLVATGRLATAGRLRHALRVSLPRQWAAGLAAVTAASCGIALVVPSMHTSATPGVTIPALAGTPLAQAQLTGRLADIVNAVGPMVRGRIDSNNEFYALVGKNLTAAWKESEATGGLVDVTASGGSLSAEEKETLAAQARELSARASGEGLAHTADTARAVGSLDRDADTPAAEVTAPAEGEQTSASEVPTPEPSATATALPGHDTASGITATGPLAVAGEGTTIGVMSTDLHCNLDMITIAGRLDSLAGAALHMDDGDLTMTGSAPEQVCVDALTRAVPRGVARVATIGNHDSATTAQQLRSRGWAVTDGSAHEVAGLRILGDVDPNRTSAGENGPRGSENATDVGHRLAGVTCAERTDVVLIHQPYTFAPLTSAGCAPLLLAGHTHREYGMSVHAGSGAVVAQLRSGAGLGGTSIGPVTADAYLHVLAFDQEGSLRGWRAVVIHPDASVTVSAWRAVPAEGSVLVGASSDAAELAHGTAGPGDPALGSTTEGD